MRTSSSATRRALVVEDEPLVASLLSEVLEAAGFQTQTAGSAALARQAATEFDPDVALLDISLGDGPSGLDLAHVLHEQRPDIALLFLTRHPDARIAGVAARDLPPGAGFLRKDMISDTAALIEALDTVLQDRAAVRQDLATAPGALAVLTSVQLQVLDLAAQGLSNRAIAAHRGTTERAVEIQMRRAFDALNLSGDDMVNERVEAVRIYIDAVGMPHRSTR